MLLLRCAALSLAALPLPLLCGGVTSRARALSEAGRSNENKWLSLRTLHIIPHRRNNKARQGFFIMADIG